MTKIIDNVSVVICIYAEKNWANLVAAVESARRQSLVPQEIIVVVDHNRKLLERVREQIPGVLVVENDRKPGRAGARNSGIAAAGGQIIAFLDAAAVAEPHWLQVLCEAFLDPWVLGAGGSVIPAWIASRPFWLPEEFYWVVGCTYRGMPQCIAVIRSPIDANMAFRREVFEKVGGFRSPIGGISIQSVGCEEMELCMRARQYWPQYVFLYKPAARVLRYVPEEHGSWHYFFARCYTESLSKAVVARHIRRQDSQVSECAGMFSTLAKGVLRGIGAALWRRDVAGIARSCAIVAGMVGTIAGYCVGRLFSPSVLRQDWSAAEKIPHRYPEVPEPMKLSTGD